MIQRDNRSVSECGVHMIGPDGIGRAGCPLCRAMVDEARAEFGERRTMMGVAYRRSPGAKAGPWRMVRAASPANRYSLALPAFRGA